MCAICGQPDYIRCQCVSAQPFCDQCDNNSVCSEIVDSQCVIYHFAFPGYTPPATKLINLGLPNGSSAQTIFEAIDAALGKSANRPWVPGNTATLNLQLSSALPSILTGTVNISAAAGNTLAANEDGLFVGAFSESFQVKVDSTAPPRYLADAIIGGTDGCVSIDVIDSGGLVAILPTLDPVCLAEVICANPEAVSTLSGCIAPPITGAQIATAICNSADTVKNQLFDCLLEVTDTATVDLTLTPASGSTPLNLTANVNISSDSGNTLVAHGNGLYVPTPPAGGLTTANNGLSVSGGNTVQLGGALIQNTLISDPTPSFDLGIGSKRVIIGNNISTTYGVPSSALFNTMILNSSTVNANGNVGLFTELILNGQGTYGSGQVESASFDKVSFTWPTSAISIPDDNNFHASFVQLVMDNSAGGGGTITCGLPSVFSAHGVIVDLPGSASASTAHITDVSAYCSVGPYFEPSGSNYVTMTNWYGLYLTASDQWNATAGLITNRYGVYQDGVNDTNVFMGQVNVKGGAVGTSSDIRIKKNIVPYTGGLDTIENINVVKYDFADITGDKGTGIIGVVAQELEQVLPEAVKISTPHYGIEDFKVVTESSIMYTMINAIKELSAKVKYLENQIAGK